MRGLLHCGAGLPPCRPASARRAGGIREGFRGVRETGFNGVPFDVAFDVSGFFVIADEVVVALVEPEGGPGFQAEDLAGFPACETFQGSGPTGEFHQRGDQHVYGVRHDHEGVKVVAPEARISVSNGGHVPVGETTFVMGHMGSSGWNWECSKVLARREEARRQGRSPAPQGGVDAGE